MGLHRDADEEDTRSPVISVSLGDTASFRIGGKNRKDPTRSLRLNSGDIVVLGGDMRLAYHGIDRILKKDSGLLTEGGRFNLTLRRVKNILITGVTRFPNSNVRYLVTIQLSGRNS